MNEAFETDYLVVGAGAAGMAFTDALLTHTNATVTIVDRRHAPGGHWVDAYPFVRLHQPSTFYGVDSVPLGIDTIDRSGLNAGFHSLANADELRAYYVQVMQQHFLPSGRVRYFPGCDHHPGPDDTTHRWTHRLTGHSHEARVRRKWVDTTYLEGQIPATSAPPFEVAEGVRCVPPGELVRLAQRPEHCVVIGGGKTALDTCVWLLTQGVPPKSIQWVRPRDGWWLNRRFHQPHTGLPDFYAGVGLQLQAMATATSVDEVFAQLEAQGFYLRIDPEVTPTMCHGAVISEAEMALLRQITQVVRLGRVRSLQPDRMLLDQGEIPTPPNTLYVHCAAAGLPRPPLRPIFEVHRVTVQPIFWSFACLPFALLGVAEATIESDDDKNRVCPPVPYWDDPADYLRTYLAAMVSERARAAHPAIAAWAKTTRLNPLAALGEHRNHPTVVQTREVIKRYGAAAAGNLIKLLASSH